MCLRFKTIMSKYNRHDMKRNTSCKFAELLHPLYNAPGWQFFELLPGPFPQTQVNMRTTESSCSGFDVTSGPRPMPRLTRSWTKNGGFWTSFNGALKFEDSTKSKNFCAKLLHKISLIMLAKKVLGVRWTLRLLPPFAGALREKVVRAPVSIKSQQTIYQ